MSMIRLVLAMCLVLSAPSYAETNDYSGAVILRVIGQGDFTLTPVTSVKYDGIEVLRHDALMLRDSCMVKANEVNVTINSFSELVDYVDAHFCRENSRAFQSISNSRTNEYGPYILNQDTGPCLETKHYPSKLRVEYKLANESSKSVTVPCEL